MQLYHIAILWVLVCAAISYRHLWLLCMGSYITLTSFNYCVCAAISHRYPLITVYVQLYHIDILWLLCICSYITLTSFNYCVYAAISHWHPLITVYVQLYHIDILWIMHIIYIKKSRWINVIFFLEHELPLLVMFLKNQYAFGLNGFVCVCHTNLSTLLAELQR